MPGIKDKVAIIGMGCTTFGELWDKSAEELMVDAFVEALADAKIDRKDIQAGWMGHHMTEIGLGHLAVPMATALKLPWVPVTHVENMCASASESFRAACYAVASGACEVALALGVEKIKDIGTKGLPRTNEDVAAYGPRGKTIYPNWLNPNPAMFGMMGMRYFNHYGIPLKKARELLAKISVKSHHNGSLNPKAHLRREITIEDVLNAPMIAPPLLGLYDCCGVSDGAACAIVVPADKAKEYRSDPIYVKASQVVTDPGPSQHHQSYDLIHVETASRAAVNAYKEAEIRDPRSEINCMEVHDCFSITEFVTYEDLLISPRGEAARDVDEGFFTLDGKIPCQTDGGLKCFGHPIGASGLRMIYEMYKQLQGKADKRQVKNPKIALIHNVGGQPVRNAAAITIIGNQLRHGGRPV